MKQLEIPMKISFRVVLAVLLVLGTIAFARDKKKNDDKGKVANINFLVVKESNGKPVKFAAVIIHPVNERGEQERGGYELKTDLHGKTNAPYIPYGTIRVQVIAPGFRTYGEDFKIDETSKVITIKLQPPAPQVTIY